jgi:hypothetical protein
MGMWLSSVGGRRRVGENGGGFGWGGWESGAGSFEVGEGLDDVGAGDFFIIECAGDDAGDVYEACEAGHGVGEDVEEAGLVVDILELFAELFDVADVDSEEVDLGGDAGRVAAAGRAEAGGVVAVFEGVGVAGWCAAFSFGRGLFGHGRDSWEGDKVQVYYRTYVLICQGGNF